MIFIAASELRHRMNHIDVDTLLHVWALKKCPDAEETYASGGVNRISRNQTTVTKSAFEVFLPLFQRESPTYLKLQ